MILLTFPFELVGTLVVLAMGINKIKKGVLPEEMTMIPSGGRQYSNFDLYDAQQRLRADNFYQVQD